MEVERQQQRLCWLDVCPYTVVSHDLPSCHLSAIAHLIFLKHTDTVQLLDQLCFGAEWFLSNTETTKSPQLFQQNKYLSEIMFYEVWQRETNMN